ncbi:MAG: glycoside hydrolase family 95-like protein, partial [Armatimonadota bacterium]
GYASTHDAQFPGFTVMAGRPLIMQVEACLAASAAVMEMLLHTTRGVLYLFRGVPARWKAASFEGLRAEGAFVVSAWREHGKTAKVQVLSEAGADLVLSNPFGGPVRLRREGGVIETLEGEVLTVPTTVGETLKLTPG